MAEIFCLNKRDYLLISNPIFGDVIMAEVGATMVGSIIQTYSGDTAVKGAEAGYFKFGGSTVVLLFERGKVGIDSDLLENTAKGLETEVRMGEGLGKSVVAVFSRQSAVGSQQSAVSSQQNFKIFNILPPSHNLGAVGKAKRCSDVAISRYDDVTR